MEVKNLSYSRNYEDFTHKSCLPLGEVKYICTVVTLKKEQNLKSKTHQEDSLKFPAGKELLW